MRLNEAINQYSNFDLSLRLIRDPVACLYKMHEIVIYFKGDCPISYPPCAITFSWWWDCVLQ